VEPRYEARTNKVAETACRKLVKDMHYEVRIQAIIQYYAECKHMKIKKPQARQMCLTKEEYIMVNI
jgi:hypothetical protein